MDWYPLGTPVVVPIAVTDETGAPVDVNPTPSLAVWFRGTHLTDVQSVDDTTSGLGSYKATVQTSTLTAAGQYRVIPSVTGANAGTDVEVFEVFDPVTYPRLVSRADARVVLRNVGSGDDPLIDRLIAWASARIMIEYYGGRATKTQRVNVRGGDPWFKLSTTPVRAVVSVTSVVDGSTQAGPFTVTHPNAGVVKFAPGLLNGAYDVQFDVGPDEIPAGLDGATLALIQHWWSQVVARRAVSGGNPLPDFRGLPNTVQNMLSVVPRPTGFW